MLHLLWALHTLWTLHTLWALNTLHTLRRFCPHVSRHHIVWLPSATTQTSNPHTSSEHQHSCYHRSSIPSRYDAIHGSAQEDTYDPDHAQLASHILQLEEELLKLVGAHSSAKHTALIRNVTRYFGDAPNIGRCARHTHGSLRTLSTIPTRAHTLHPSRPCHARYMGCIGYRIFTELIFRFDLNTLAVTLRSMYGLNHMSDDGFRLAVRVGPNTFKVGTTGIAPGE